MKIIFDNQDVGGIGEVQPSTFSVYSETDRLTDVLLCSPEHISPVPCCSVTRESLREGFRSSIEGAVNQHAMLRRSLEDRGVKCHVLAPSSDMSDMCFTRDTFVSTPWGPVGLRPATKHRAPEVDCAATFVRRATGQEARRISVGAIEGGDICIARDGLLVIGISGERTDDTSAAAFAAPFERRGWDVIRYPFDPHFLHLDTIFCMLDERRALVCTDVSDDWFIRALAAHGIEALPVTYKEARKLGCNVLSLDGTTILANAATPRVTAMMRAKGYEVLEFDISEFTACGGGIHCLTMPLHREPASKTSAFSF